MQRRHLPGARFIGIGVGLISLVCALFCFAFALGAFLSNANSHSAASVFAAKLVYGLLGLSLGALAGSVGVRAVLDRPIIARVTRWFLLFAFLTFAGTIAPSAWTQPGTPIEPGEQLASMGVAAALAVMLFLLWKYISNKKEAP